MPDFNTYTEEYVDSSIKVLYDANLNAFSYQFFPKTVYNSSIFFSTPVQSFNEEDFLEIQERNVNLSNSSKATEKYSDKPAEINDLENINNQTKDQERESINQDLTPFNIEEEDGLTTLAEKKVTPKLSKSEKERPKLRIFTQRISFLTFRTSKG